MYNRCREARHRALPKQDVEGVIVANAKGRFLTCQFHWGRRNAPNMPPKYRQGPYVHSLDSLNWHIRNGSAWVAQATHAWSARYDRATDTTLMPAEVPVPFSTMIANTQATQAGDG